jgi:phosphatidylethanolamine/phosphatidyl-N-methylethanolamine N-methyltransferase
MKNQTTEIASTHKHSSSWGLFTREIWRHPITMGAVCPSSSQLAKAVAKLVPVEPTGWVVELGPGTGVVTKALLEHGVIPEKLITLELSQPLANYLQVHFPQVTVIQGDAIQLSRLLAEKVEIEKVSAIISSLPFRSLPKKVKLGIVQQIDELLFDGGLFLPFTYDLTGKMDYLPKHFERIATDFIWYNIPPARVDVFRSHRAKGE